MNARHSGNSTPKADESLSGYQGVPVVVFGAAGFIGRWVARALCDYGARVTCAVRDPQAAQEVFTRFKVHGRIVETDLLVPGEVSSVLEEAQPRIVFNLAGYGVDRSERDPSLAYQTNSDLVVTIAKALSELPPSGHWAGQQVVHTGSALEYGAIGGNLNERSQPKPTTLYGKSKLEGTLGLARSCRQYGLRGITARLFSVYGPGEHPGRLLPSLMETCRTGIPLPLTAGLQKRDFTYAGDVAEGLLRLGMCLAEAGEVVNLASGKMASVREFIDTAAGVLGLNETQLLFGALPTRAEEMDHLPVANQRLKQLTSWQPAIDIANGVALTRSLLDSHSAGPKACT